MTVYKRFQAYIAKRNVTQDNAGFSLVELLVVLAIIALVTSLVGPRVLGYLGSARQDTARTQIKNVETALELYYLDIGQYPSQEDGLAALVVKPNDQNVWNGPYLKGEGSLEDPWGRAYGYQAPTAQASFRITSLGRDGAQGGDGEDRDIP
ncbi:type II secretion system major pseudopilin GspG [Rhizobium sp. PP-CC-3G-465]|uniref:type II secretion system major pseudopilin GspG n=1 Tax=Rhizobium sp. PP-CC-3G-465 TaxID=2135648 RepID=UPI0010445CE4